MNIKEELAKLVEKDAFVGVFCAELKAQFTEGLASKTLINKRAIEDLDTGIAKLEAEAEKSKEMSLEKLVGVINAEKSGYSNPLTRAYCVQEAMSNMRTDTTLSGIVASVNAKKKTKAEKVSSFSLIEAEYNNALALLN
jgi:hypothetical protein